MNLQIRLLPSIKLLIFQLNGLNGSLEGAIFICCIEIGLYILYDIDITKEAGETG